MADLTRNSDRKNDQNSTHRPDKAAAMDIRDPDAFQGTLLGGWSWLEKNAVPVGGAVALGLLILIGVSSANWWKARQERKAQEVYYAAEAKFSKLKEGFDRAKMRALMPALAAKDTKGEEKAATGELEKDYGTAIGELEAIARNQAGTAAGTQAAILVTETYLNYGKADKAVEIAEIPAKKMDEKSLLGAMARIQLGSALAAKGNCAEAVKIWSQVVGQKSTSYLHADASLRMGLCYEQMSDSTKALEFYQKASAESGADSTSSQTAKGLFRALELKTKSSGASPAVKKG